MSQSHKRTNKIIGTVALAVVAALLLGWMGFKAGEQAALRDNRVTNQGGNH